MNAIVAVLQARPDSTAPTAADLLGRHLDGAGPDGRPPVSWQEGATSLAGAGPQVSLAVTPDLAVLVDGRLDDDGTGATGNGTVAQRIAAAVRLWGEPFLDHVVGDVSGVVVDRVAGSLFAFRDLVGPRPLHLAYAGHSHLVATRPGDLAGLGGVLHPRLDEEWMTHFLDGSFPPPRLTPFAGMTLVVPGHVARPRNTSWLQMRRAAWQLHPEGRTDSGHAEALRSALDEAVRCRLVGVERAGVELSGGMDSTSVLACARAVRPDLELVALAIPFTDPAGDERSLQELVAQRCGARLRWVPLDGYGPLGRTPADVVAELGAPPQVPNWFLHAAARDAAVGDGIDVVLTGEDGDGLLGAGPVVLSHLLTSGSLVPFLRELAALRRTTGTPTRRLLRRSLEAAHWLRPREGVPLPSLVPADRRSGALRSHPRPTRPGEVWARHVRGYLDSQYLPWLAHAVGQEWTALPHGAAHPFLDRRVIELSLSLPAGQRLHGGLGKAVLRRAMSSRLPVEVLTRAGKARLSEPFDQAMRSAVGQRTCDRALQAAEAAQRPWLSIHGWRELRGAAATSARDFAEYRAVMTTAFAEWIETSVSEVSAPERASLLLEERR